MGLCPLFYFSVPMVDVAGRAEQLITDVIAAEGLELVHVEYQPRGAASLLRVYIDKPGGVNLDDCQRLSKHIGVLLDVEDFIPHHYVLEVSSPGIERPLFREADYRRFQGKEIQLVATEKIEGRRNFRGYIGTFSERVLKLECEDQVYTIPFEKIRKANLVCRF